MCCVALVLIKVVIYFKTLVDTPKVGGVAHCLSKVVAELGPFIFELMFCKSYFVVIVCLCILFATFTSFMLTWCERTWIRPS
jgi:hypothetical protein